MKEVTIKYKSNKTLEALKELGKYLNFSISDDKARSTPQKQSSINGIPIIIGDAKVDIAELHDVFTGKDLSAEKLRDTAWQRKK
ncbi:hypothetical protein [Pedobacter miscanthi]|uniref:Uncharacterized protein n=1 Tax=Pedobacter miscanthi TaxID=2259170 RepID=A0A366KX40_9SPHI|nr:hypothetical protein [Pedobacter miscanthi]RBQ06207.1 hypothetical protein DRW42_14035 [Pedobacter miscanthi]